MLWALTHKLIVYLYSLPLEDAGQTQVGFDLKTALVEKAVQTNWRDSRGGQLLRGGGRVGSDANPWCLGEGGGGTDSWKLGTN